MSDLLGNPNKFQIKNGEWWVGDCLELMKDIPDGSVDMVLCDLPYGTTACKWDTVIPFEPLWREYHRVVKDRAAMVLTASQPFTSALVMSNIDNFKYEWIWQKNRGSNFASLRYQPMKEHESVLVFGRKSPKYCPIKQERSVGGAARSKYKVNASNTGKREALAGMKDIDKGIISDLRYPGSVQKFNTQVGLHPTQKPVKLFEYLIKTYTNKNDLVLDNTAGSGTTAVAAENTNRRWICIERDHEYSRKAMERVHSS